MSFGLYYPAYTPGMGSKPRFQSTHPFRNLVAAGSSHMNNQWDNGQSGYGLEPPDYDYHSGPPAHVPSGGSYSYHATTGTGYGPAAIHPPVKPVGGGGGGKKGLFGGGGGKKRSSAMSALTLLSFLFFINLLQGCIKDHMDAMNPTVMVMTNNVIRNRFNKMGDMNSREQKLSSSNSANLVVQTPDLAAAAAAQASSVAEISRPYSNKINPYNKPLEQPLVPPQPPPQYTQTNPEPEIPINYNKPSYYDPHKPDNYEQTIHLPAPQHTLAYNNHSLQPQTLFYNSKPTEQQYTYHHTEYSAQTVPQLQTLAPLITSQHSINQNPFYEHQHPVTPSKPYNFETGNVPYGPLQHDYHYHQPQAHYTSSVAPNNAHPWSSNLHSASVVSGPFRRASIISVSPKTKWISVPAKITDRTNFEIKSHLEQTEQEIVHHDDRDLFRSRMK